MKNTMMILLTFAISFGGLAKEKVEIKASEAILLTYAEFANYDVKISNVSGKPIDVSVIDPNTEKQVSGFGLGPLGKAVLTVKEGHVLKLQNNSMKNVSVNLSFVEKKPVTVDSSSRINFTLQNTSTKTISLIIPDVMNPNLSPLSNSGVALKMGQQIFYKKGLRKYLLFTVDESIQQGDKVDIAKLIRGLEE